MKKAEPSSAFIYNIQIARRSFLYIWASDQADFETMLKKGELLLSKLGL